MDHLPRLRAIHLLALLLACLLPAVAAQARQPLESVQPLLDSYARNRHFNGVVLVARDGEVLRAAYGKANLEWDQPNTTDTRFRIGSLSKPFTAVLVMQLVQEGKLQLDGKLAEYLPDLYSGTPAADITLAQLLNHTSGLHDLPGRFTDPWWQTYARHSYLPQDFAKAWIPGTLDSAPGAQWRYNNAGYFVLGLVIERVSGEDYADNLSKRILAPAGMSSSGLYRGSGILPRLASGYENRPDGSKAPAMFIDATVPYAAAGVYSTVDDLYRFGQALGDGALLDADARKRMWTPYRNDYGYGWGVEQWKLPTGTEATVMSHTGSIPGYQSFMLRSDAHQAFVAILDNEWQGELVMTMGKDLMEVLLGKPPTPAKKSLADLLVPIAVKQGDAAMASAYDRLGSHRQDYDQSERAINALGYRLLRLELADAAISVFRWNTQAYPDSANAHDSLGEAYRAAGRPSESLASYRRSLALDPHNDNARKAIAELQTGIPGQ